MTYGHATSTSRRSAHMQHTAHSTDLPHSTRLQAPAARRASTGSALERMLASKRALALALAVGSALGLAAQGAAAASSTSSTSSASTAVTATGTTVAGPAVAFTPGAFAQPTFATPVVSPIAAAKSAAPVLPTTADPGVLVPGGRRQSLFFSQLGALDPLQLHGVDGQNGVAFSIRRDEVVTGAVLHLIYSYSRALLPDLSQLNVLVNGEVVATLPLPTEQAGMPVSRDVTIDPRFITEFNHLNVQLIGHYTRKCEDPSHSSLWATVSNASALELTYAPLPEKADLAALPRPFFDRRDVRRLELPFVFAKQPGNAALEAAGIVASWFGAQAGYRGARFPAQLDALPPSGNAVVLATQTNAPAGVTLPTITGPTIAVVDRAAPAQGKLLLVLGRDDAELKVAAKALGIGGHTLSGQSVTIAHATELAPRAPYDAPNWLPTDRPVHLGELADAQTLNVTGYNTGAIPINLRVPPDLFMWQSQGAPIDLRYRYTVRPTPDRSSLQVSVNDGFVQSFTIPARHDSIFDPLRYFGENTADGTGVAHHRLHVPALLLTPQAQLRLHFFYDIPDTGECHSRLLDNVMGSIDPDSTIDLSAFPHYMALPDLAAFANSGFPFTRLADLSETAVVLPDDADNSDLSLYLLTMGRMGASTGFPVNGVTIAQPDAVDKLADKDLIVLGAPGRQPLLQRWAKSISFSGDRDSRTFEVADIAYKVEDWWHGERGVVRAPARASLATVGTQGDALLTGFESPLHKGRSVVVLIAAQGTSSDDLSAALLDADVLPHIQGATAIVHGRTVTVTSNGDVYYVGRITVLQYLRWALSKHPLLLAFGGMFAALVIGALFYRVLRSIAARRLGR